MTELENESTTSKRSQDELTSARPNRRRPRRRPTSKKTNRGKKGASGSTQMHDRVFVSADQLPRKSLEQSLRVANALRDVLAGGPAGWAQIASAMGIGSGRQANKYYVWSAQAYGLVEKDGDQFSLSENGRRILAPTKPGEEREAIVRAMLTPVIFSRFFTDYNGSPFPAEEHIGNVLEVTYGVPRQRVEEAKTLLRENGVYSGVLRQENEQLIVRLDPSTTGVQPPTASETSASDGPLKGVGKELVDFAKMCFVITPIGSDESEERKHANLILKSVIEPVAIELGLVARRADQIDRAGIITQQIFECLAKARVCVADLSFSNPNAFYELGVRHMCKAPTVQLIRKGDPIPFDVSQGRTIKIDMTDVYTVVESIDSAKKELKQHLKHALGSDYKGEDNPVNTYLPGIQVLHAK